jgi:hypothetical protein
MRVQEPKVQEPFRVAYVTDEETSSARPARRTSLFGNPTFGGPAGDQKSPLRRCFKPRPLVENECKPVASDRRSGCGVYDPGGCPASCPDAHRPARSHRHVRIRQGNTYAITTEDTRCDFIRGGFFAQFSAPVFCRGHAAAHRIANLLASLPAHGCFARRIAGKEWCCRKPF